MEQENKGINEQGNTMRMKQGNKGRREERKEWKKGRSDEKGEWGNIHMEN